MVRITTQIVIENKSIFCSYKIKEIIAEYNYDIIAVSETWLTVNINSSVCSINNYSLIRNDRASRGGCVALYIKNCYRYEILNTSNAIEQLWITIPVKKTKISFCVAYRPPNLNYSVFLSELENSISQIYPSVNNVIIVGDFNIDILNVTSASVMLLDLLSSFDLKQVIKNPTRIAANSSTLIDVIIMSENVYMSKNLEALTYLT